MAHARLQGVDGGGAGTAAPVDVVVGLRPAWARLSGLLLPALTDKLTDEVAGEGRPGPRRVPGPPPFEGADAARVEALVALAQRGDVAAFGQLYERSVDTVYRYLYVRTRDRQVSEDLTSETFVRALRTIGSFTWQGRDIVAWFLTIARNLLHDLRKSSRFRLEITTDELLDGVDRRTPEDVVVQHHRDRDLVEALRRLTSDQAECVVLRFMEGLSLAECAEVLGRKENAVKQLQLRAIRALRKELGRAG